MIRKKFFSLFILLLALLQAFSQTASLSVETRVGQKFKNEFHPTGRLFLFISESSGREPRLQTWPGGENKIYAINLENWKNDTPFLIDESLDLAQSDDVSLNELPVGRYRVQILWAQNRETSQINAAGNLYSETEYIDLTGDQSIKLLLTNRIAPVKLADHELLHEVDFRSQVLSEWWGKEMRIKAAVLLPHGYFKDPDIKYPVRYNIAGFGGRYTRANRFVEWDTDFLDWWKSDNAPRVINVFLDGEGPFGDCYQLNSANSGPYGTALIEELIPHIEKKYRGLGTPESRYLDGCSTGGWVSLALQLFYPDFFNGCFSYSPDPVDFGNFQLIDIYHDSNAFFNEHGYLRPVSRDITGEPIVSQKDFIRVENVLGWNNSYITSGGQFGAFTALFSPKGEDGLPKPLFDPVTGDIDHEVAEHWQKYDLTHYTKDNWRTLGPKIKGKIWIWMGDMDNFYLNPALRSFDEMLQPMKNPIPDAAIRFSPMKGHCSEYSHKKVLLQIAEKLNSK